MDDQSNRRTKESVAIVIKNEKDEFLVVQRATDDSFGDMWGLPAASLRKGESLKDAANRAAKDKLGVEIEIIRTIGDRTEDKGEYDEHLTEFEVRIVDGNPKLAVRDASVSRYADMKFTSNSELLVPAAQNGSICSRIFLNSHGLGW